jgi:hypothetical protein
MALAVGFVYLAARRVTDHFFRANTDSGLVLERGPAVVAGLVFAFGGTVWSQAVIAEVYALQALLTAAMLWLALEWGGQQARAADPGSNASAFSQDAPAPRWRVSLVVLAFFAGLMLAHHRLSVLVIPALAIYVLSYDRAFLRQPFVLAKMAVAFALPLLLYLYLPIRGTVTSSLDGAYQNSFEGFWNWVLGTAYTVFITQNPFQQERPPTYYVNLFVSEFTLAGIVFILGGVVALFLRAWREWLVLALGLTANLVFAVTYRVADIDVFFIPSFVFAALFLSAGIAGLVWLAFYAWPSRRAVAVSVVALMALLLLPLMLYRTHYDRVDLSRKTDIAGYGRLMLAQPLPDDATIIGILGEMTLIRYFQETQGLRPDIETVAADTEEDRARAIEDALRRGRSVYLTRPLAGIQDKAALSSVGPLIEVRRKANRREAPDPAHALDLDFGNVTLLGFTRGVDAADDAGGLNSRTVPVTLFWRVENRMLEDRLVSLKLLDANGGLAGQLDRQPVLDAYPTSAWRNGEYITDAYDLPIFVGAQPGEYQLQVTMYDPNSGHVFGQTELGPVTVLPETRTLPRDWLDVSEIVLRDLGEAQLVGYEFEASESYPPGAAIPITLLWRAGQGETLPDIELKVLDPYGKVVHSQTAASGGDLLGGQYARQGEGVSLPAGVAPGIYTLVLEVRNGGPLALSSHSVTLGRFQVSGDPG